MSHLRPPQASPGGAGLSPLLQDHRVLRHVGLFADVGGDLVQELKMEEEKI